MGTFNLFGRLGNKNIALTCDGLASLSSGEKVIFHTNIRLFAANTAQSTHHVIYLSCEVIVILSVFFLFKAFLRSCGTGSVYLRNCQKLV